MGAFYQNNKRAMKFGLIWLALFLSFIFICIMFYWLIWDNNFNPPSDLYPVEYTTVVPEGGSFKTLFISHRFRDCYVTSDRVFINEETGDRYEENRQSRLTVSREGERRLIEVPLPEHLTQGSYSYDARITYYCNPANNIFGGIVLDPPPLFFRIGNKADAYQWSPQSPRVRDYYRKK